VRSEAGASLAGHLTRGSGQRGRLHQARRAQIAARIIRRAYGIDRKQTRRFPIRFELVGSAVALAVVREYPSGRTVVKVARLLPDGRVQRMLKECRSGFGSLREQHSYFETLYQTYGDPS
jgi:hypothetical protein